MANYVKLPENCIAVFGKPMYNNEKTRRKKKI